MDKKILQVNSLRGRQNVIRMENGGDRKMEIQIRKFHEQDLQGAVEIWNQVVEDGVAFPQTEKLTEKSGKIFFEEQSYTGIAVSGDTGKSVGLYILHPNNVGRCGHICNASYAVDRAVRGQHVGEQLVRHCISTAGQLGFRILQFNAVVRSNQVALALYRKLGFVQLGIIPGGFRMKDGSYEDIIPHYYLLNEEK